MRTKRGQIRRRIASAVKATFVLLALVFFAGSITLLWVLRTGRANPIVQREVRTRLWDACQVKAEISTLELELFPPELRLGGVTITEPGGRRLVGATEALVSLAVLPLFYGRLEFPRIALLRPEARVVVVDGRVENLPACLAGLGDGPAAPKPAARSSSSIGLGSVSVERASIELVVLTSSTASAPGRSLSVSLADADLAVERGRRGGSEVIASFDHADLVATASAAPGIPASRLALRAQRFRAVAHVAGMLASPRAITVDSLAVEGEGVVLAGSGSIDLLGPVYEARLDVSLPLDVISRFVPEAPPLVGDARLVVSASGDLTDPRVVGTVELTGAKVDGYGLGDHTRLLFSADRRGAELRDIVIELGEGSLIGTGKAQLAPKPRFSADLDVSGVSLAHLIENLALSDPWVDLGMSGKVQATGVLEPSIAVSLRADMEVEDFTIHDRAFDDPSITERGLEPMFAIESGRVKGSCVIDPRGVTLKETVVHAGSSRGVFTGRFNFAEGFRIRGEISPFDFFDMPKIGGVHFAGRGSLAADVGGPWDRLTGLGTFELDEVEIADMPLGRASGRLEWRDFTRVFVRDIEGRLGRSSYVGSADVDLDQATLSLSGEVPKGRVEDVLVPFRWAPDDWGRPSGDLVARFQLSGPVDAFDGTIDGRFADLTVFDERFEDGRAEARLERGKIHFHTITAKKRQGSSIEADVAVLPRGAGLEIHARSRDLALSHLDQLHASAPALDGPLELSFDLKGPPTTRTGTLTLALERLLVGKASFPGGRLVGRVAGPTMDLGGRLLDALDVSAKLRLAGRIPFDARLELAPFDAPALVTELSGMAPWTGRVAGRAELKGELSRWLEARGQIGLDLAQASRDGELRFELGGPTRFTLADGTFTTKRAVLRGPNTMLVAFGDLGRRLDLDVEGQIDLELATKLFAPVERSAGRLALKAAIRATDGEIDLVGTGHVEDGLLEWRGLPDRLVAARAELVFSQSAVLIDRLEGRWAGGELSGSGSLVFDGLTLTMLTLSADLAGTRPEFVYPKFEAVGVLDGHITLTGPLDHLELSGQLEVERPIVRPTFEIRQLIAAQRLDPSVYDPASEILHFDVELDLKDPLVIKNDTTDVTAVGKLVLTGTNQRVGIIGDMQVREGRVSFLGRDYQLERGEVEFRARYAFEPQYSLALKSRACDSDIYIHLVGSLERYVVTYNAQPEMAESNIVSCLVSGAKIQDLENLNEEGSQAFIAGQVLWGLSGVDREVKKVLPVDQIELTSEYSARERLYEPRLLVAKEVLDGRVRLEYSSSLVKTDDQRAAVRYRFGNDLTLQAGWTSSEEVSIGDLGLDLRYRWEW